MRRAVGELNGATSHPDLKSRHDALYLELDRLLGEARVDLLSSESNGVGLGMASRRIHTVPSGASRSSRDQCVIPAPFCCQPVATRGASVEVFRVGAGGRSVGFAGPGSG